MNYVTSNAKKRLNPETIARCESKKFYAVTHEDRAYYPPYYKVPFRHEILYMHTKRINNIKNDCILVTGFEFPSQRAKSLAKIVAERIPKDTNVVSGLRIGIDKEVHENSLSNTIAVFDSNIDTPAPTRHAQLASKIVSNNSILLSVYPPNGSSIKDWIISKAPPSNQVLVGMSKKVIVIEGAKRGNLIYILRLCTLHSRPLYVLNPDDDFGEGDGFNYKMSKFLHKTYGAKYIRNLSDLDKVIK